LYQQSSIDPELLSSLQILLPVFGLVFAGFACRRRGVLGPSAASELNRFVVWLALPALLFDITAQRDLATILSAGLCSRIRARWREIH
jgi:predicted permease